MNEHRMLRFAVLFFVLLSSGAQAETIPAPLRTVLVSSSTQLSSALASAIPGDHIVLTNNSYAGVSITKSGTTTNPIVVRAANLLAARITSDISIRGNAVWLVGLNFGNKRVLIYAADDRVTRSYFSGGSYPVQVLSSARRARVDHNEVDNKDQGGLVSSDRHGFRIAYNASAGANVSAHRIYRNYLHNTPRPTAGHESNNNAIASAEANTNLRTGTVIEYNLVSAWYGGRCIYTKAHAHTIQFNTCVGGSEQAFHNRSGNENKWLANWSESFSFFEIHGLNNQAIGNRVIKGSLRVKMGTCASDATIGCGAPPNQEAAANTLVAGNIGGLVIGHRPQITNGVEATFPALNTRVEAHQTGNGCGQGSITCGGHSGTTFSATTSSTIPQAFKLTPAAVGPNAPTAPVVP